MAKPIYLLAAIFLGGFALLIADARTEYDLAELENIFSDRPEIAEYVLPISRETHFLYRLSFRDPWPLYGDRVAKIRATH